MGILRSAGIGIIVTSLGLGSCVSDDMSQKKNSEKVVKIAKKEKEKGGNKIKNVTTEILGAVEKIVRKTNLSEQDKKNKEKMTLKLGLKILNDKLKSLQYKLAKSRNGLKWCEAYLSGYGLDKDGSRVPLDEESKKSAEKDKKDLEETKKKHEENIRSLPREIVSLKNKIIKIKVALEAISKEKSIKAKESSYSRCNTEGSVDRPSSDPKYDKKKSQESLIKGLYKQASSTPKGSQVQSKKKGNQKSTPTKAQKEQIRKKQGKK